MQGICIGCKGTWVKDLIGMRRWGKFICICDKQYPLHMNKHESNKEERAVRK